MPSSGPVERAATRRVPLRALFAGVICLALVASVWTVLDLSRDAHRRADERTHTQRLRVDLVRLQAVGWHGLAEGAPDFTIATEAKTLGARVRREARALPELPGGPSERVRVIRLVDELLRGIDAEMVDLNGAANAAARRELTTTLLGSTDLLDAALDAAERHAGRQAASAGSRLLRGTLIAIGAVGLLLAAGFLIVRRVRRAMEDALRHQAFHDVLTGLPNRALFDDRLTRALARARRGETEVAVVLVDLDDFKAVNDSLGHAAGDELLVECARRFDAIVRATDTAARLGGDEFAVLVADRDAAAAAADVARRLREALDAPFPVQGRALHVGASLGVALAEPGADPLDVVRNADIAMYAAKDRGGDELVAFRPEMLHAARERLDLREDLRHALERGELCVHYQPVVSLADGQMMAVEALLRWTHPVHGEVSPVRFIPVAEETGMIVALGAWVLAQACRDLPTLQRAAPDVRVGVNVSAVQLREPGFVEDVRRILEQTGVAPEHVVLELTESVFADDASVADALKALGALGVALSVDDFGTGYSSLSYLRRLDVDSVKIDRSFVAGLGEEPRDAALVRSIIELGHALGLTMVAEGVEEPDQEHFLRDAGCDLAQGWLFGRPAPIGPPAPLSRRTTQAPSPAPS